MFNINTAVISEGSSFKDVLKQQKLDKKVAALEKRLLPETTRQKHLRQLEQSTQTPEVKAGFFDRLFGGRLSKVFRQVEDNEQYNFHVEVGKTQVVPKHDKRYDFHVEVEPPKVEVKNENPFHVEFPHDNVDKHVVTSAKPTGFIEQVQSKQPKPANAVKHGDEQFVHLHDIETIIPEQSEIRMKVANKSEAFDINEILGEEPPSRRRTIINLPAEQQPVANETKKEQVSLIAKAPPKPKVEPSTHAQDLATTKAFNSLTPGEQVAKQLYAENQADKLSRIGKATEYNMPFDPANPPSEKVLGYKKESLEMNKFYDLANPNNPIKLDRRVYRNLPFPLTTPKKPVLLGKNSDIEQIRNPRNYVDKSISDEVDAAFEAAMIQPKKSKFFSVLAKKSDKPANAQSTEQLAKVG